MILETLIIHVNHKVFVFEPLVYLCFIFTGQPCVIIAAMPLKHNYFAMLSIVVSLKIYTLVDAHKPVLDEIVKFFLSWSYLVKSISFILLLLLLITIYQGKRIPFLEVIVLFIKAPFLNECIQTSI